MFAEGGRKNSVLDGLRVRQFDVIEDEISETVDCKSQMTEEKFLGVYACRSRIVDERCWKS